MSSRKHAQNKKDTTSDLEDDDSDVAEVNLGGENACSSVHYVPGAQLSSVERWLININFLKRLTFVSRHVGALIDFKIDARHITIKNREVLNRHLWGTGIFSFNSYCMSCRYIH